MRITHGWGYKRLAAHFGVDRDTIRRWLNGPRGAASRGERLPSEFPDDCSICGGPCNGDTCMNCKAVRRFNRYSAIEQLFGEGLSYEAIAAALGTTANRVGADVQRMRLEGGWRVPWRQGCRL